MAISNLPKKTSALDVNGVTERNSYMRRGKLVFESNMNGYAVLDVTGKGVLLFSQLVTTYNQASSPGFGMKITIDGNVYVDFYTPSNITSNYCGVLSSDFQEWTGTSLNNRNFGVMPITPSETRQTITLSGSNNQMFVFTKNGISFNSSLKIQLYASTVSSGSPAMFTYAYSVTN